MRAIYTIEDREQQLLDERWDSVIDRLEIKYGLRLDDWKRLGRDQMGQKCGRGWQGLKGACKRVPKGGDKAAAIKASKLALADKIRAKKGMRDRNKPNNRNASVKTIYDLEGDKQQQALSQIVSQIRLSASGRRNIYHKAVAVLEMTDDQIIENYDAAGAPGLPDGYGGDGKAFAEYSRAITSDGLPQPPLKRN